MTFNISDTEGSFNANRTKKIAEALLSHIQYIAEKSGSNDLKKEARKLSEATFLDNILVYRIFSAQELIACIKNLDFFMTNHEMNINPIRLIVIDSIAYHFRNDFEDLALRTRVLSGLVQDLLNLSNRYELATIIVNHVTQSNSGIEKNLIPALGTCWAHACNIRLQLQWDNSFTPARRKAILLKSSSKKSGDTHFDVTSAGIRDIEELISENSMHNEYLPNNEQVQKRRKV